MRLVATFALAASLCSCASIISGGRDTITVNSTEPGTTIYVDGALRGRDTASVDVKRGKPHVIRVEKVGFQPMTVETGESFDGLSFLGIFIDFGIITIPIDLVSGGAWKTNPTTYTVNPLAPGSAPAVVAPAPAAPAASAP